MTHASDGALSAERLERIRTNHFSGNTPTDGGRSRG